MSKPEGIPQDVRDKAEAAAWTWGDSPSMSVEECIARAIMAERERCALLAFAAYDRKTELCSKIIRRIRSGEGLVR